MRARSTSPKEKLVIKLSSSTEKNLSNKYKKLRIESQENQIKIIKLLNELEGLQNFESNELIQRKSLDLCLKIIQHVIG